jgi:type 1 fimbriae regulatory protein FimB/type 1 fimbriae regulatory protein FimE
MTAAGFRKLLTRVAECSSISFPVHPHMLRHACGYKLYQFSKVTEDLV